MKTYKQDRSIWHFLHMVSTSHSKNVFSLTDLTQSKVAIERLVELAPAICSGLGAESG